MPPSPAATTIADRDRHDLRLAVRVHDIADLAVRDLVVVGDQIVVLDRAANTHGKHETEDEIQSFLHYRSVP
jgi:hypothetical protein